MCPLKWGNFNLKKKSNIFFSVANNHAKDFGSVELEKCIDAILNKGFNFFGTDKNPYMLIENKALVYSATQWSNHSWDGLSLYSNTLYPPKSHSVSNLSNNIISILYPHWGYEFEIYPRDEMIQSAKHMMEKWDAIIGHHSHCPQPITLFENSEVGLRPLAYSLGNFAIAYNKELLNFGLILSLTIGKLKTSDTNNPTVVIAELNWNFISIKTLKNKIVLVEICIDCPWYSSSTLNQPNYV